MDVAARLRFSAEQKLNSIRGVLGGNGVRLYWYRGHTNFGDILSSDLLSLYGLVPAYSDIENAELVCVGSILQVLPEDFSGVIAGSGLISNQPRRFPSAQILAVRGELTRELLGLDSTTVLGDPGLLSGRLIGESPRKKYPVGIVPHYVDKGDQRILHWSDSLRSDVRVIDVERDPVLVLNDIASCESVLSSSLHGLICADALGVPNAWLSLSGRVIGDGFKFRDYASSVGRELQPYVPNGMETVSDLQSKCRKPDSRINDCIGLLDETFRRLRGVLTH